MRIAAFLYDPKRNELHMRFREAWDDLEPDDLDILELLADDMRSKALEFGAEGMMRWMMTTLSHTFRLSDPMHVRSADDAEVLLQNIALD